MIIKSMDCAPTNRSILMRMKHGWIEGTWDPESESGRGYYWQDMEWYADGWCEIPETLEEELKESETPT